MEVSFEPDVQAKLARMADESVRRFDDLESGRARLIDGEEAYRLLMERTEAQRRRLRPA